MFSLPFAPAPPRFEAVVTKATVFPSPLIDGALDAAFAATPPAVADTSLTFWAPSSAT